MSHTYALLPISAAAYAEIRAKLVEAGYAHAFNIDRDVGECIDMHGIAVHIDASATTPAEESS